MAESSFSYNNDSSMAENVSSVGAIMVFGPDLLSDEGLDTFATVVIIILCCPLTVFGMVANSINCIIFYKQGFTECVNISLFALAISDFGALITLLYVNISLAPWFKTADINIRPREVMFLVGAWPHVVFARTTCWITVLVTSERCMCIVLPFKVKSIFVPRVVVSIIISVFIISIAGVIPVYFTFALVWVFVPLENKWYLDQTIIADRTMMVSTTYLQIALQCASFVTIIVLTITLVVKLKQSTKWRASVSSAGEQQGKVSTKETKIIRMIIAITCILIVCFAPSTVLQLVWVFEPRFSTGGQYHNAQMACWLFAFLLEAFNSSVNICVYYNMSSTYRGLFNSLFGIDKDGKSAKD